VFPGGETPEGLIDMTGNTWDWTGSKYQPYPYDTADGRVVRGGAWYISQANARAAVRYTDAPGLRSYYLGFRLACSSPI
ncbi:MAG TPA: SUMF1/EgtB/PvdO family nonheme iron enzyme, partial [Candidatus Competibacteraceae bacterium]|nr:SUMF1/EgtB/PvdO family nonheme iron enzyme [Candidatus Competibacteraceae bacterium]